MNNVSPLEDEIADLKRKLQVTNELNAQIANQRDQAYTLVRMVARMGGVDIKHARSLVDCLEGDDL